MYFPFLAEAPEFARRTLDSLRQPLESGEVEIQRARIRAVLPARVQLVLAANPCPCGRAGSLDCTCSPHQQNRYFARLSGPLTDRIDLRLPVHRVTSSLLTGTENGLPKVTSAEVRERVTQARAASAERWGEWAVNADVPGEVLREQKYRLPRPTTTVLDRALARGQISMRGYDRCLRLAWSVSDLAGKTRPDRDEVAQALALRGGVPL